MNLEALEHRADKHLFDMKALMETAATEDRGFSDDEKKTYADLEKGLADVNKQIANFKRDDGIYAALDDLTGGGDKGVRKSRDGRILVSRVDRVKTFGQLYIDSEAFKWHNDPKEKEKRGAKWDSPSVDLPREALARFAALTEDPASGGAVVVPDYQRTIVPGAIQPIVVADLCAPGTTGSNVVPVMVEKTFTNAAAPVAETGIKPESTLVFELQSEPVRKIAHWIPVSEELLEDAPAVGSYVNARLSYGVLRKEDQQLLFGTGIAPELQGILSRAGLAPDVVRTDPANNADAILIQIMMIQSTTGLPVSGIVMNPLAFGAIAGLKEDGGTYIGDGPFAAIQTPTLWGLPVALTDQISPATALVGAFRTGAQVFRHGGVRVNSTNSHADYFIKNMVAIRAEERLALAVYRPAAFGKVTGLTTVAPAA